MSKINLENTTERLREFYKTSVIIPEVNFYRFVTRVQLFGWTRKDALITPMSVDADTWCGFVEYYRRVEGSKVTYDIFKKRVRDGWKPKIAAINVHREARRKELEYYQACKNPAVDFELFSSRVNKSGWNKVKAIHTPALVRGEENKSEIRIYYDKNFRKAKVTFTTFKKRIERGWAKSRALLAPTGSTKKGKNRELTQLGAYFRDNSKIAAVSYRTFISRVKLLDWNKELALTTKPSCIGSKRRKPQANKAPRLPKISNDIRTSYRQFYKDHVELAKAPKSVFMQRVIGGEWDKVEALLLPTFFITPLRLAELYDSASTEMRLGLSKIEYVLKFSEVEIRKLKKDFGQKPVEKKPVVLEQNLTLNKESVKNITNAIRAMSAVV